MTKKIRKTSFELNLEREVISLKESLKFNEEAFREERSYHKKLRGWDNERIRERDELVKVLENRIKNYLTVIELLGSEIGGLQNNLRSTEHNNAMKEVRNYQASAEQCNTIHPEVPAGKIIEEKLKNVKRKRNNKPSSKKHNK